MLVCDECLNQQVELNYFRQLPLVNLAYLGLPFNSD